MNHLSIPSGLQIGGENSQSLTIQPKNSIYNDTLYTKLLNIQKDKKKCYTKKNKPIKSSNKNTKKYKPI